MVVIGCDSDAKICEFIKETPAQWATVAECEADMKQQMLTAGAFQYPTVTGLCRAVKAAPGVDGPPPEVAALPAEAPLAFEAERPVYAGLVEGGRGMLYRTANGYTLVRTTLGRAAAGTAELARRTGGQLIDRLAHSF